MILFQNQKSDQMALFVDTIHGFRAECRSKSGAWALIRNKCHELGLQVPMMTQIKEVIITKTETK